MLNRMRSIGTLLILIIRRGRLTTTYRSMVLLEDLSRYPIPPTSLQPPYQPLLDPHPFHKLYECGFVYESTSRNQTVSSSFSIMPSEASGSYQLAGDGYIFADENSSRSELTWYTVDTTVPLAQMSSLPRPLRASGHSPLFDVRHELHVAVTCAYDVPDTSDQVTGQLQFSIPLHFVHVTPIPISRSVSPPPSSISPELSTSTPSTEMLTPSLPYVHSLPASFKTPRLEWGSQD